MTYGMNGWNKTNKRAETRACDSISREFAINDLYGAKVDEEDDYLIGFNDGIDFAVKRLSVMPSARPEPRRKKGRWSGSCCSVCGVSRYNFINILHTDSGYRGTWKYCPNCGADMREVDDKG